MSEVIMRPDLLVYMAGPYSGASRAMTDANIGIARVFGRVLLENTGCYPVIPHSNTPGKDFEELAPVEFFYEATLTLMKKCDAVYMMPNWQDSKGSVIERDVAIDRGMPVFLTLSEVRQWADDNPAKVTMLDQVG